MKENIKTEEKMEDIAIDKKIDIIAEGLNDKEIKKKVYKNQSKDNTKEKDDSIELSKFNESGHYTKINSDYIKTDYKEIKLEVEILDLGVGDRVATNNTPNEIDYTPPTPPINNNPGVVPPPVNNKLHISAPKILFSADKNNNGVLSKEDDPNIELTSTNVTFELPKEARTGFFFKAYGYLNGVKQSFEKELTDDDINAGSVEGVFNIQKGMPTNIKAYVSEDDSDKNIGDSSSEIIYAGISTPFIILNEDTDYNRIITNFENLKDGDKDSTSVTITIPKGVVTGDTLKVYISTDGNIEEKTFKIDDDLIRVGKVTIEKDFSKDKNIYITTEITDIHGETYPTTTKEIKNANKLHKMNMFTLDDFIARGRDIDDIKPEEEYIYLYHRDIDFKLPNANNMDVEFGIDISNMTSPNSILNRDVLHHGYGRSSRNDIGKVVDDQDISNLKNSSYLKITDNIDPNKKYRLDIFAKTDNGKMKFLNTEYIDDLDAINHKGIKIEQDNDYILDGDGDRYNSTHINKYMVLTKVEDVPENILNKFTNYNNSILNGREFEKIVITLPHNAQRGDIIKLIVRNDDFEDREISYTIDDNIIRRDNYRPLDENPDYESTNSITGGIVVEIPRYHNNKPTYVIGKIVSNPNNTELYETPIELLKINRQEVTPEAPTDISINRDTNSTKVNIKVTLDPSNKVGDILNVTYLTINKKDEGNSLRINENIKITEPMLKTGFIKSIEVEQDTDLRVDAFVTNEYINPSNAISKTSELSNIINKLPDLKEVEALEFDGVNALNMNLKLSYNTLEGDLIYYKIYGNDIERRHNIRDVDDYRIHKVTKEDIDKGYINVTDSIDFLIKDYHTEGNHTAENIYKADKYSKSDYSKIDLYDYETVEIHSFVKRGGERSNIKINYLDTKDIVTKNDYDFDIIFSADYDRDSKIDLSKTLFSEKYSKDNNYIAKDFTDIALANYYDTRIKMDYDKYNGKELFYKVYSNDKLIYESQDTINNKLVNPLGYSILVPITTTLQDHKIKIEAFIKDGGSVIKNITKELDVKALDGKHRDVYDVSGDDSIKKISSENGGSDKYEIILYKTLEFKKIEYFKNMIEVNNKIHPNSTLSTDDFNVKLEVKQGGRELLKREYKLKDSDLIDYENLTLRVITEDTKTPITYTLRVENKYKEMFFEEVINRDVNNRYLEKPNVVILDDLDKDLVIPTSDKRSRVLKNDNTINKDRPEDKFLENLDIDSNVKLVTLKVDIPKGAVEGDIFSFEESIGENSSDSKLNEVYLLKSEDIQRGHIFFIMNFNSEKNRFFHKLGVVVKSYDTDMEFKNITVHLKDKDGNMISPTSKTIFERDSIDEYNSKYNIDQSFKFQNELEIKLDPFSNTSSKFDEVTLDRDNLAYIDISWNEFSVDDIDFIRQHHDNIFGIGNNKFVIIQTNKTTGKVTTEEVNLSYVNSEVIDRGEYIFGSSFGRHYFTGNDGDVIEFTFGIKYSENKDIIPIDGKKTITLKTNNKLEINDNNDLTLDNIVDFRDVYTNYERTTYILGDSYPSLDRNKYLNSDNTSIEDIPFVRDIDKPNEDITIKDIKFSNLNINLPINIKDNDRLDITIKDENGVIYFKKSGFVKDDFNYKVLSNYNIINIEFPLLDLYKDTNLNINAELTNFDGSVKIDSVNKNILYKQRVTKLDLDILQDMNNDGYILHNEVNSDELSFKIKVQPNMKEGDEIAIFTDKNRYDDIFTKENLIRHPLYMDNARDLDVNGRLKILIEANDINRGYILVDHARLETLRDPHANNNDLDKMLQHLSVNRDHFRNDSYNEELDLTIAYISVNENNQEKDYITFINKKVGISAKNILPPKITFLESLDNDFILSDKENNQDGDKRSTDILINVPRGVSVNDKIELLKFKKDGSTEVISDILITDDIIKNGYKFSEVFNEENNNEIIVLARIKNQKGDTGIIANSNIVAKDVVIEDFSPGNIFEVSFLEDREGNNFLNYNTSYERDHDEKSSLIKVTLPKNININDRIKITYNIDDQDQTEHIFNLTNSDLVKGYMVRSVKYSNLSKEKGTINVTAEALDNTGTPKTKVSKDSIKFDFTYSKKVNDIELTNDPNQDGKFSLEEIKNNNDEISFKIKFDNSSLEVGDKLLVRDVWVNKDTDKVIDSDYLSRYERREGNRNVRFKEIILNEKMVRDGYVEYDTYAWKDKEVSIFDRKIVGADKLPKLDNYKNSIGVSVIDKNTGNVGDEKVLNYAQDFRENHKDNALIQFKYYSNERSAKPELYGDIYYYSRTSADFLKKEDYYGYFRVNMKDSVKPGDRLVVEMLDKDHGNKVVDRIEKTLTDIETYTFVDDKIKLTHGNLELRTKIYRGNQEIVSDTRNVEANFKFTDKVNISYVDMESVYERNGYLASDLVMSGIKSVNGNSTDDNLEGIIKESVPVYFKIEDYSNLRRGDYIEVIVNVGGNEYKYKENVTFDPNTGIPDSMIKVYMPLVLNNIDISGEPKTHIKYRFMSENPKDNVASDYKEIDLLVNAVYEDTVEVERGNILLADDMATYDNILNFRTNGSSNDIKTLDTNETPINFILPRDLLENDKIKIIFKERYVDDTGTLVDGAEVSSKEITITKDIIDTKGVWTEKFPIKDGRFIAKMEHYRDNVLQSDESYDFTIITDNGVPLEVGTFEIKYKDNVDTADKKKTIFINPSLDENLTLKFNVNDNLKNTTSNEITDNDIVTVYARVTFKDKSDTNSPVKTKYIEYFKDTFAKYKAINDAEQDMKLNDKDVIDINNLDQSHRYDVEVALGMSYTTTNHLTHITKSGSTYIKKFSLEFDELHNIFKNESADETKIDFHSKSGMSILLSNIIDKNDKAKTLTIDKNQHADNTIKMDADDLKVSNTIQKDGMTANLVIDKSNQATNIKIDNTDDNWKKVESGTDYDRYSSTNTSGFSVSVIIDRDLDITGLLN